MRLLRICLFVFTSVFVLGFFVNVISHLTKKILQLHAQPDAGLHARRQDTQHKLSQGVVLCFNLLVNQERYAFRVTKT